MPAVDLVLKNANVITMDARKPHAELVAIEGNRICLVADSRDLESVSGAKTRVIDCRGRTVMPGFNDAHCHVFSFIRKLLSTDLSPSSVGSIADIKRVLSQKARATPPGKWLSGTGCNEFYLAEKRCPNRWELDEAAPYHPVVVSHRSLHACILNSLALSLVGITRETPEPPGALIDRDPATGEPTGLLFEMLGYIREKAMPPLSEEELAEGAALANRHYLSYGITSLQEATVSNNLAQWQTFRRFKDAGVLKTRISMMFGIESLGRFREEGMTPGHGDNRLRLGGVKLILNETTGQLFPPQPELNRQVLDVHLAGFQLAIHAIVQAQVEAAVASLEYAQSRLPRTGQRHRIEHCSECPPDLLKRLSNLQAVIVTQPPFLYYSGERYLAEVPASQQPWLYRINSFLNRGLIVAGSSDSPVVPDNPLVGIYSAVTRQTESGQQILPEEGISAGQALALYTTNAARASFEEDVKGTISQGKLADVIMLSNDPLKLSPDKLKDIRVELTVIDGKVVWEANIG